MGKRSAGGSNLMKLRRRLEQLKLRESSTVDEIVHHLRDNYPDYHRTKLNDLNRLVEKTLDSFPHRTNLAKRSKRHRTDPSEESSSEDGDGAASTLEEDEVEQELDLMKSMLRAGYTESTRKATTGATDEKIMKIVELELPGGHDDKIDIISRLPNYESSKREAKGWVSKGFKDLGGMEKVVEELKMEVLRPLRYPQLLSSLGGKPKTGILLHGPPGCGKTELAHAIANETGLPFYPISATQAASEENIRELFQKAYRTAPSIVFIDEIDAIASKRENLQRQMDQRIVTQLMTCMSESHRSTVAKSDSESSDYKPGYVLVIGATNRPDALDPALRRPGRFEWEIELGVPNENARVEILGVLTRNLKLEGSLDLLKIARSTAGFVGVDLAAVVNKAVNIAFNRVIDERESLISKDSMNEEHSEEWWRLSEERPITMADFEQAVKLIQPSSKREGFSTIPNVKWEDVGGLDLLREEFVRDIVLHVKYPELHEKFGVDMGMGFLLYGPPGCGKTLIAKAIANEAGINFIYINGPELLDKYVGESERAVRTLFSRARACSPCILFFDEVDALTTERGNDGGWVVERLLSQLLTELDGADRRQGVFVIGATNRKDAMDPAVLRPGRFGKHLYIPLPGPAERGLILQALARNKPIDPSVDLNAIGRMEACENFSGAHLAILMNEAAKAALYETLTSNESSLSTSPQTIKTTHFELVLTKISPSVSERQKLHYQKLSAESFKAA